MGEQIESTNGKSPRAPRMRVPTDESRADKFVRLAKQRMSRLKAVVRHVTHLANYPHTDAQRDKILSEMRKLTGEVEAAFAPSRQDDKFNF